MGKNPFNQDVATALGYSNTRDAIRKHVDDEDKTTVAFCDGGSNHKTQAVIINESGLYALILGSKLPQAQEFKRWVTAEVLPQIRKTGGYIPVQEGDDEMLIMARALLIMQRTVEQQKKQLADQRPKVRFAEAVTSSENSILFGLFPSGFALSTFQLVVHFIIHHTPKTISRLKNWDNTNKFVFLRRNFHYDDHCSNG